jgi:hypothetical protein
METVKLSDQNFKEFILFHKIKLKKGLGELESSDELIVMLRNNYRVYTT